MYRLAGDDITHIYSSLDSAIVQADVVSEHISTERTEQEIMNDIETQSVETNYFYVSLDLSCDLSDLTESEIKEAENILNNKSADKDHLHDLILDKVKDTINKYVDNIKNKDRSLKHMDFKNTLVKNRCTINTQIVGNTLQVNVEYVD
jgi:hypothetical protein